MKTELKDPWQEDEDNLSTSFALFNETKEKWIPHLEKACFAESREYWEQQGAMLKGTFTKFRYYYGIKEDQIEELDEHGDEYHNACQQYIDDLMTIPFIKDNVELAGKVEIINWRRLGGSSQKLLDVPNYIELDLRTVKANLACHILSAFRLIDEKVGQIRMYTEMRKLGHDIPFSMMMAWCAEYDYRGEPYLKLGGGHGVVRRGSLSDILAFYKSGMEINQYYLSDLFQSTLFWNNPKDRDYTPSDVKELYETLKQGELNFIEVLYQHPYPRGSSMKKVFGPHTYYFVKRQYAQESSIPERFNKLIMHEGKIYRTNLDIREVSA